jgi:hypothetical protein
MAESLASCPHQSCLEYGQSITAHHPQHDHHHFLPGSPRVIVSFHTNEILATDSKVEQILGYCDSELHGSSVSLFSGPITDSSIMGRAIDNAAALKPSLFDAVLYHKTGAPHNVRIASSPFFDASNVLVACMLDFQHISGDTAFPNWHPGSEGPATAEPRPSAGDGQPPGFLSLPGQDGAGPAIFPRRKAGSGGGVQPVVITPDVLRALAGRPLSEAAQRLGVSATALKHACRKLGILRWPYKKGGGLAARPCVIDDAYVQRLYRKYTAERRCLLSERVEANGASRVTRRIHSFIFFGSS